MERRVPSRLLIGLVAGALLPSGCSYSSEEPGLLGRPGSDTSNAPAPSASFDPPSPRLPSPTPGAATAAPVLAAAEWTSADGNAVTVRIAVHAVRRVAGGTVLDWSVTPLAAPGLTSAGVPPFDLALLSDGRPAVLLLDPADGAVFRPVRLPSGRCVCSLIGPTADGWRIGETRLLQIAYPALPAALARVDVSIATVPVVGGVPVTAVGRVPRASAAVDLTRSADLPPPYLAGPGFSYAGGQRLAVQPHRVLAGPTATTLVWRIQALDSGPGLTEASTPPLAGTDERITGNRVAASGPVLVAGERRLTARLSTDRSGGRGQVACLCSDLRSGTGGLRSAGQLATVLTTYDPLPAGVREVLVEFPGYGQRRIDVTAADTPSPSASTERPARTWTSPLGRTPVWTPRDWPTPVPNPELLAGATPRVDRLLR